MANAWISSCPSIILVSKPPWATAKVKAWYLQRFIFVAVCGCDFSDIPLANAVFALTVQALQGREHWFCRERVVKTVSILIGRALDR